MKSETQLNTVVKTFKVIEFLCENQHDCTLTEVAKNLQFSIGTIQRITGTLLKLGYIQKESHSKKLHLTSKWLRIGFASLDQLNLRKIAISHLKKLNDKINETVSLAVLDKDELVYVERFQSSHHVTTNIRPGDRRQLHCTSIGKAILAFQTESDRKAILDRIKLIKYTSKTIVVKKKLLSELTRIKKQGFAENSGEITSDLFGIAVPIINNSGVAVAGVNIVMPKLRFSKEKVYKQYLPYLVETGKLISSELGHY